MAMDDKFEHPKIPPTSEYKDFDITIKNGNAYQSPRSQRLLSSHCEFLLTKGLAVPASGSLYIVSEVLSFSTALRVGGLIISDHHEE